MPIPHRPAFNDFTRFTKDVACVPVYRQLTGDGLTPVSAFRKIARSNPSFLFESVIGGEKVGRFSFLGTEPFLKFEARGHDVVITSGDNPEAAARSTSQDPFRDLETLIDAHRAVNVPGLPPFPAAR